LGEGFDALNGLWYLYQDEKGQAILCFASTIPIAGWAVQGGKWAWKGAKKFGKAVKGASGALEFVELTDEAVEIVTKRVNDLNFPTETLDNLANDLKNSPELLQKFADEPGLIDSWKVLESHPILRKKAENLSNIRKCLDKGIEPQKLVDGIANSSSKQNLIDELGVAQSKLHVQVLIKDYDNIPGIAKGRYYNNSSTIADKADLPSGWSSDFDINQRTIETFTGKIEPLELKPGDKIYRVSNANGGGGPYWTKTKPENLGNVVGGMAVQPEWNNFEYVFEYTVPEGRTIKTWQGKAARQQVSDISPGNYHLPGGDEQLFINYIERQDPDFQTIVKFTKAEW
jgi:hypothetical protein